MKHLKSYKLFEASSLAPGDKGSILYKIPGTDNREVIPIEIEKKISNSNMFKVIALVDVGTVRKGQPLTVSGSKILYDKDMTNEPIAPMNPNYSNNQPVPTDYNSPGNMGGGGVTNDVVLPNS